MLRYALSAMIVSHMCPSPRRTIMESSPELLSSLGYAFLFCYNIPTVKNQIALRQLTYLGKIFCREYSHIPTRLLTVWCDHPRKFGRPILTNNQYMVRNIQQVILNVDAYGAMSTWGFHTLDAQHWNDLLNTLRHPSFEPPENDPNTPQENYAPPPEQT